MSEWFSCCGAATWGAHHPGCDKAKPENQCHAGRDGDCTWKSCPQTRDGEPMKSRRHCPLDDLEATEI
jgi:hypothetical protein